MLNWFVWNRTDYLYKNGFGIKYSYKGRYAIKPNQPTNQPFVEVGKNCRLTVDWFTYLIFS